MLACPACSDDFARWTVDAEPRTVTGLDGRQVMELAGPCRRCGTPVACQPTEEGAASIRQYEESRRDVSGRLLATLDAEAAETVRAPLDAEAVDSARAAVAAEVVTRRDAAGAAP